MDELMLYLAKVASAHLLIFLIYHLMLRRGTHFTINRFFLLTGIIIPFIIPMIKLRTHSEGAISLVYVMLEPFASGIETVKGAQGSGLIIMNIITTVYFAGVLFMIIRSIHQILIILKIHKSSLQKILNGHNVRIINDGISAFSFMQNIYISNDILNHKNLGKIILHEKVHIGQYHSADVILAELLCTFLWFNPFSWKLRGSLKEVHEYLADAGVRKSDPDTTTYFSLIANQGVGLRPAFINQFNQSLTLKRLKMMTKKRSGKFAPMKTLIGIPVLLTLIIAFSGINQIRGIISINDASLTSKGVEEYLNSQSGNVGIASDTPPKYPGGDQAMMKFMQENIRYPESAKKAGKEGVVYVQFTVTEKGSITDVKVKKAVEPALDAEAVRVVSMMPDWIPGTRDGKPVNITMVLPVSFMLGDK